MTDRATSLLRWATLASLLVAFPARGETLGSGAGVLAPLLMRISGFVDGAPAHAQSLGAFTLGVDDTVVELELSAVQTLNGPLTEGPAALRQFDLFNPNLLVVGDSEILRKLTDAPPHTQVTLFGYVHPGARRMFVVEVDAA